MKFIHTSDLHIGSPLSSRLSAEKTRERKKELLDSFSRLVDEAKRQKADAVIIAGDLFDSQNVSKSTLDKVITIIERATNITFFYLSGNHEKSVIRSSVAELPKNLKLFGEEWTYFDICGVRIAGRESTSADMFSTLFCDGAIPTVLVLHGELRDRCDRDGAIGRKDAAHLKCDYMALGHYHSYSEEKINGRCTAVYCGTPEGRGFDETGECGYVCVEIDERGERHTFVPHAARALHICRADMTGVEDLYTAESVARAALAEAQRCDLVRLVLCGHRPPLARYDIGAMKRFFENKFYYFEIVDETKLKINPSDYEHDRSLKGEFIRLVLSSPLTDEEKDTVIECGLYALMGEDIPGRD